jgi:hypothetical protein
MDGGSNPGKGVRNRAEFDISCWWDNLGFAIVIMKLTVLTLKEPYKNQIPVLRQSQPSLRLGRGLSVIRWALSRDPLEDFDWVKTKFKFLAAKQ